MPTTLLISTALKPLCEKPTPRLRLEVQHKGKISRASPAKINRLFTYFAAFPMDPQPRAEGRAVIVTWKLPDRSETFIFAP